jgi:hypothetical protein
VNFTGINRDQPKSSLGELEEGAEISNSVDAGPCAQAQ